MGLDFPWLTPIFNMDCHGRNHWYLERTTNCAFISISAILNSSHFFPTPSKSQNCKKMYPWIFVAYSTSYHNRKCFFTLDAQNMKWPTNKTITTTIILFIVMTFSNCFRNLTNTFQKLSVHRLCQLRHQSYIFIPSPIHSSDAYPPALPPNYGWIQPIIYFVYVLLFVMLLETYPRNLT